MLSLGKIPSDVRWCQFFAIFIPDEYTGNGADGFYEENRRNFCRQAEKFKEKMTFCKNADDMEKAWESGKTAAFLSVENGNVLCGNTERVKLLAEHGVSALTLTWNGENELGSGVGSDCGLKQFGKNAVAELEKYGILADVSHLNDRSMYDFLEVSEKPFAATHSNVRSVCGHKRNLTDEFVKEMVRRNCLTGLNYYNAFLRDDGAEADFDDILGHIFRFLELGAERCLALGSDFDGAEIPQCINSPEKVAKFYEYTVLHGIPKQTADLIFFGNARRFLHENLN